MNPTTAALTALYDRIPRRHSVENLNEIKIIVSEYEELLRSIEGANDWYEKNTTIFFDDLDAIRSLIKKSSDNKASKKAKDSFFDEASGALKDSTQALIHIFAEGIKKA